MTTIPPPSGSVYLPRLPFYHSTAQSTVIGSVYLPRLPFYHSTAQSTVIGRVVTTVGPASPPVDPVDKQAVNGYGNMVLYIIIGLALFFVIFKPFK